LDAGPRKHCTLERHPNPFCFQLIFQIVSFYYNFLFACLAVVGFELRALKQAALLLEQCPSPQIGLAFAWGKPQTMIFTPGLA
jgi:hypothetical protein